MMSFDSAADRRAGLSHARLPEKWRPWMKQWSTFRGQAWKIDQCWSPYRLIAHAKGRSVWGPLTDAAPPEIVLIDECVAELVGSTVAHQVWDRDYLYLTRHEWTQQRQGFSIEPYWDDDDEFSHSERGQSDDDRRLEERLNAAREREGELVLVHYLLPRVRLYGKLKAFEISERAYYYRLNLALATLRDEYYYRAHCLENVQS